MAKEYDYLLKVLLVGDSDVGKCEILSNLDEPTEASPFCSTSSEYYQILLSKRSSNPHLLFLPSYLKTLQSLHSNPLKILHLKKS